MPRGASVHDMSSKLRFRKRVLTAGLLSLWLCMNFVLPFFARDLSFTLWDWPLHFWLSAQGSLLVFLAIVVVYAWLVNRWEAQFAEEPEDTQPT